ncbi:tyrosine-type recombinase/integrase [Rhodococcus opacus]|uniref:tyrosine-type recombinase/integrase n=1 Tax=Rhodococcus opacus TaxID=37919 RepID=UPI0007CD5B50|nr:tyrosine-type recombinase/integrase [Rhodococcus opacus]MDX5962534.1 tyrosine-type recombinase/integrase [Rhodococcus opacus]MDX5969861.1 tyrosine-type recombinase/integrase [Rhodococcus opacus]MDX5969971.1 tyrosine-type recombinase/integrase [Rhodococcus opacus]CAG7618072.1 Tyrosine recombinase XerC [Rhodococcus opacus]CAG7640812.1 Tyrosine recombinase XerC [Rhodococcus opacus]
MSRLAPILQGFFTTKLITQRHASAHTIGAYRDTWRLLLIFAERETQTPPWKLDLSQLDHDLVTAFLRYLETERHNGPRTLNARLAAIHSLFRYAALHALDNAATIQRVLAIQGCRKTRTDIDWLTDTEADALLNACDRTTWIGRRDHAIILTGLRTGMRVSELTSLTCADVHLGTGAHVRCVGKGRKERCTPLDKQTVNVLCDWLTEQSSAPGDPLFPTRRGHHMTRDAFQARLTKYQPLAAEACPSLAAKKIAPHILRHSNAMALKRSGVDISVIALWLGHEDIRSTQIYVHADLELKERILTRTAPIDVPPGRYQPPDQLLAYLESL